MFDVQSFHCSGQAEFHTSVAPGLKPETRNLKPMLGEGFTTPDNVPKKELFS
jgi:hypothetical protein